MACSSSGGCAGDLVVGPRQVVEALWAALQIAALPLVESSLAAAKSRADLLDGAAGETETDGGLARREVVVQGVPRGTAAGGCPRGSFKHETWPGWRPRDVARADSALPLHEARAPAPAESSTMRQRRRLYDAPALRTEERRMRCAG
jgi:hypothetical protein